MIPPKTRTITLNFAFLRTLINHCPSRTGTFLQNFKNGRATPWFSVMPPVFPDPYLGRAHRFGGADREDEYNTDKQRNARYQYGSAASEKGGICCSATGTTNARRFGRRIRHQRKRIFVARRARYRELHAHCIPPIRSAAPSSSIGMHRRSSQRAHQALPYSC